MQTAQDRVEIKVEIKLRVEETVIEIDVIMMPHRRKENGKGYVCYSP